jgi:hypothetical protein
VENAWLCNSIFLNTLANAVNQKPAIHILERMGYRKVAGALNVKD